MRPKKLSLIAEKEGLTERQLLICLFDRLGSQAEVAEALGVSQSRVSQYISEHNLKTRQILVEKEPENV